MELLWDRGTILIEGDPPREALGFAVFDPRVKKYRCMAIHYSRLKRVLEEKGIPFEDRVMQPACSKVEAKVKPELRHYQREALEAWLRYRRGVIVMPTGAGKTFVAIAAIAELSTPAMVVVPTVELVEQWRRRLSRYFPGKVGAWYGEEKEENCLLVTTYDSAYLSVEALGPKYPFLVFDEVHHLPSESYRQIAELSPAPYRLGLTATPERSDNLHALLDELVGPVVYEMRVSEASGRYLAEFEVEVVKVRLGEEEEEEYRRLEKIYLEYIRRKNLKFKSPAEFRKLVMLSGRDPGARRALEAWVRMRSILFNSESKVNAVADILARHRGDKILIFTEYTSLARAVSERYLIPLITHDTSSEERRIVLEGFRTGVFRAIVTGKVLDEGIDVPDVNVVVILGGTSSRRQFIQRIGRALRLKPGKAKIYEVVTASTREVAASRRRRRDI
ncbi:DEAD/DEAH box helicase [Infirmifilum lucidum]|uniref:DEAD/DEAH box helicase n=1 Tax=Infirmifilum lucidum TaxID=2776706 RepID=UPI001CECC60B|nr:DEAD/DEAH box helicase family protein [Infirmifilum lucidum]